MRRGFLLALICAALLVSAARSSGQQAGTTLGLRSKSVAAVGDLTLKSIPVKFLGVRLPSIELHGFSGKTAANASVYGATLGLSIPLPRGSALYISPFGVQKVQTFARLDPTIEIGIRLRP